MPFFLVTQTLLVEAQDEQEAAQTGVHRLRSGGQVTVSVKSSETTIAHVVVAAMAEKPPVSLSDTDEASPAVVAKPDVAEPDPAFTGRESRKLILKRMLADGLLLLGRRT